MAPPSDSAGHGRRSGLRKRPGVGGNKTDRNGDVIMGNNPVSKGDGIRKNSSSTRGRGGSRSKAVTEDKIRRHLGVTDGSNLAKRVAELPRKKSQNRKVFRIVGLEQSKASSNPDRGEHGVVDFLERKSANLNRRIRIIKSRVSTDYVLHVMVSEDDSEELMKLNGFSFAGAKLTIAEDPAGWGAALKETKPKLSQESLEHKRQLQGVLTSRYAPENRFLDLSRLGEDPVLISMGYLSEKDRAEKTFKVLMAICNETFATAEAKRESVQSVSLANNNIDWVGQVYDLAETFPELKNLDLSNNQIKTVKSMNRWRGRFRHLELLLLTENPIVSEEPNMVAELKEWFPRLQTLNDLQIRTPAEIAAVEAARAAEQPAPIPQFGPDFRDVSGIAETFLTQFLGLYDTDRAQLISTFYDASSKFSLSVTTTSPRDQGDAPVLPWAAYLRYSRNLTKITSRNARIQRLVKGAAMIGELWRTLPQTKHPDLGTGLHKYIVDCHPLPGIEDPSGQSAAGVDGLLISMHGEFDELDAATGKEGKRSFTRTFVLGPALPGSPAAFRVVNDMLSLRAHHQIPGQAPPAATSEQEQKQKLIAELSAATNMNPQYSEMCLAESGWDLTMAMAKFQELRPSLGPEVFLNGTA